MPQQTQEIWIKTPMGKPTLMQTHEESGPYSNRARAEEGLLALNRAGRVGRILTYLVSTCARCHESWTIEAGTYAQHGCGEVWDNR